MVWGTPSCLTPGFFGRTPKAQGFQQRTALSTDCRFVICTYHTKKISQHRHIQLNAPPQFLINPANSSSLSPLRRAAMPSECPPEGVEPSSLPSAADHVSDMDCDSLFSDSEADDIPPPPPLDVDVTALDGHIAACARSVWGVEQLRPRQILVLRELFHPGRPNQLIVVERTGGGKTMLLQVAGVLLRGVALIFVPFHAITADIMRKFKGANDRWGHVDVYHLDELYDNARSGYCDLLTLIKTMK